MSQSRGKKRAAAAFEWHENNADNYHPTEHQEPRTTCIRHTGYDLDALGRSSYTTTYLTAPASPDKRPGPSGRPVDEDMDVLPHQQDCPDMTCLEDGLQDDAALDPQYQRHITQLSEDDVPKRRLRITQDCNTFLRELLRWDGRGDQMHTLHCPNCEGAAEPTVRCEDCYGGILVCVKCAVKIHRHHPTHRVEVSSYNCLESCPILIPTSAGVQAISSRQC